MNATASSLVVSKIKDIAKDSRLIINLEMRYRETAITIKLQNWYLGSPSDSEIKFLAETAAELAKISGLKLYLVAGEWNRIIPVIYIFDRSENNFAQELNYAECYELLKNHVITIENQDWKTWILEPKQEETATVEPIVCLKVMLHNGEVETKVPHCLPWPKPVKNSFENFFK